MNKKPIALLIPLLLLGACATQEQRAALPEGEAASAAATAAESLTYPAATEAPALLAEAETPTPADHDGDSIWPRLRGGFTLDHALGQPRVMAEINYYKRHPHYLERVFDRGDRYLHHIVGEAKRRDMPLEIALLPVVESAFHPFAYSHGRAAGLWQFIPATGKRYGLKQNWWFDGRRDIVASTDAALDYLEDLHKRFDGDWLLALAAYNSGGGTVNSAVRKNRKQGQPTDFWSLDLPRETEGYVPKLLAIAAVIDQPHHYGVDLPEVEDAPGFAVVETGGQIDLALAAELADISIDELYWYNPGYNQWATDPNGPHRLLIPSDKAERFARELAALPADKRITWKRYRIANGDVLGKIAQRHNTSVELIRELNDIKGNNIRAGNYLIIPVATRSLDSYSLSAKARLAATQDKPRRGSKQHYIVRSGDTLWDISRNYQVSTRELAKWNNMAPRDTLRPGQKLVVWVQPKSSGKRAITAAAPPATIRPVRYTVRRGDSLARISDKFNVTVGDLLRWNKIDKQHYLQPGQKLTLYVDVTRQADAI